MTLANADKIKLSKAAALLKIAVTKAYALIRDTDHQAAKGRFDLPTMIKVVVGEVVADDWIDREGCEYLETILSADVPETV